MPARKILPKWINPFGEGAQDRDTAPEPPPAPEAGGTDFGVPGPAGAEDLDPFESLVADAMDRLPEEFQRVLESVPVIVSDLGSQAGAYGHYFGDGVARERYEDRIVIYRDTLERDFGHDRRLLAAQVERTLRHELAHHLGWGERGVGELGL
ncbi:MAG: metallopeptidase family protein [Solirubrobacterales bacterium]